MRRISLAFLFAGVLVAACAETTDTRSPSSSTDNNDSGPNADASKRDGSAAVDDSSVVVEDAASVKDTGTKDSTIGDSAKDVATSDTGATQDSGGSDAALDATTDAADAANPVDAADAAPPCVPPAGNFARCGVATATSEYSGFGAPQANDGDINTSWYAATGACPTNVCPGTTISVTISLDDARSIGRVKIFGNRDYPSGYDTLTARIELLSAADAVLYTADVTAVGADADVDHVVGPVVSAVKAVRVIVLTGDSTGPGIAEIEAYAN